MATERRESEGAASEELIPGTSSIAKSIAHAVVIKDEELFLLTETDGGVPLEHGHGFGLYYHDCRYLDGYELRIAGKKPEPLVHTAERGDVAVVGLTNPALVTRNDLSIARHRLEIKWTRAIDGGAVMLEDTILFHNRGSESVDCGISLAFRATFEDVFVVRGMSQARRGRLLPARWDAAGLRFVYEGADGIVRSLLVSFEPQPTETDGACARFWFDLAPRKSVSLAVTIVVEESRSTAHRARTRRDPESASVHSDSLLLNRTLSRSLRDLAILRSHLEGSEYFAAGIPWFATLFGRDSILTALQTLAYMPWVAQQTLRLLARHQGRRVDPWREEEPGRILHELRVGEMAGTGEIPHTPYYGTVDATPLFLMLLGEYCTWMGDLDLYHELREHVDAALAWIATRSLEGDGYLEYETCSERGLVNQGWKDSGEAVVRSDGCLATPPIALVEVQAYVYAAKRAIAALASRAGEHERSVRLLAEAEDLKLRFNREFWLEDATYALALEAGGRRVAVSTSNAGHALWCGVAEPDKARRVASRLVERDMWSGFGIRTLSEREIAYNPLGYHLGTVWPHDNSLVVSGLKRYGFDEEALQVFVGLVHAAVHFDGSRLPELFGGFGADEYEVPVPYPVACQPQAWSAGAMPYMLSALLGLVPEGFDARLRVVRPRLPDFVNRCELHGLRVGTACADVKFERAGEGFTVQVLRCNGPLDVVVEP